MPLDPPLFGRGTDRFCHGEHNIYPGDEIGGGKTQPTAGDHPDQCQTPINPSDAQRNVLAQPDDDHPTPVSNARSFFLPITPSLPRMFVNNPRLREQFDSEPSLRGFWYLR